MKRTTAGILFLSLVSCPLDPDLSAQDKPPHKTANVSGWCLDAHEKPVPRTKVSLYLEDYKRYRTSLLRNVLTGKDGAFLIEGVPLLGPDDLKYASYFLVADSRGRAIATQTIRSDKVGSEKLTLVVGAPHRVTGVVRDMNGRPLARARVWVRGIDWMGHGVFLSEPHDLLRTKTNAKGEFVLERLPADLDMQIEADGPLHAPLRITCKAPNKIEFALQLGGMVEGRVLLPDGKPAAFVVVQAQGTRNHGWASVKADAQGRYRLQSLPEDSYNIWAKREGWTVVAHDSFSVEGGETKKAPDLRLAKGGFISGRVVDTDGKPVCPGRDSDVAIYGPSRPRSGAAVEIARIHEDGTFKIRVAPGSNYIYLRQRAGWRGLVRDHNLDVKEGQTVKIEFVVERATGKGQAKKGKEIGSSGER